MLRNQLALTEGLKDNQQAITQGFNQFERLAYWVGILLDTHELLFVKM